MRTQVWALFTIAAFLLLPSASALEPPSLLQDISPTRPQRPSVLKIYDGGCVFIASDGLWSTDGTIAGTRRLQPLYLDDWYLYSRQIKTHGNTILLYELAECCGDNLTHFEHDFSYYLGLPRSARQRSSQFWEVLDWSQYYPQYDPTFAFADVEGSLYHGLSDDAHGEELWRESMLVSDIWTGVEGSTPSDFLAADSLLYFTADDGVHGRELWVSDGSGEGTRLVCDISPGDGASNPRALASIGDAVFVSAETAAAGRELWLIDAAAGSAVLLQDLQPGQTGSDPDGSFVHNGEFYFVATANGRQHLWAASAQPGTARLVYTAPLGQEVHPSLTFNEGEILFRTSSSQGDSWWQTPSPEGPVEAIEVQPPEPILDGAVKRWRIGDQYIFTSGDAQWQIPAPARAEDLFSEFTWRNAAEPTYTENVNGTMFLAYGNACTETLRGVSVMRTPEYEIEHVAYASLHDYFFAVFDLFTPVNGLMFMVGDYYPTYCPPWPEGPTELWRSDGTRSGSFPIYSGAEDQIFGLRPYRGRLIFYASKSGLMISDGTETGTQLLMPKSTRTPYIFAEYKDRLYLLADALMVTDGTPAGTGPAGLLPPENAAADIVATGDYLYIQSGTGVWRSDGTAEGTVPLSFPTDTSFGLQPAWNDSVLLLTGEGELWSSNGTLAGTHFIVNNFGSYSATFSPSRNWLALPNSLPLDSFYFVNAAGQTPHPVSGIGAFEFTASQVTSTWHGDTFFLTTGSESLGQELWYARAGTDASLNALDLRPGAESSHPSFCGSAGDNLVIRAKTPEGTRQYWAIETSNNFTASPLAGIGHYFVPERPYLRYANKLLFRADDLYHGNAFWGFEAGPSLLSVTREGNRKLTGRRANFIVTFTHPVDTPTPGDFGLKTWFLEGTEVERVEQITPTQCRVVVKPGIGKGTLLLTVRRDHDIRSLEDKRISILKDADYEDGEVYDVDRQPHDADANQDFRIGLSELLRIIQFYNLKSIHCDVASEDGFAPGPGATGCRPHSSDYSPQNWRISLSELLRLIQVFNFSGYYSCDEGVDGFCLN
jgi:ELWxxDGT repeat protein